jgi:hypothetical protein
VFDRADDFDAIGAAGLGGARVRDGLDDYLDEQRVTCRSTVRPR